MFTHASKRLYTLTGVVATVAMGLVGALIPVTNARASVTADAQAAANSRSDVQVIAFQQTWNTIAQACTTTYGPEGVGYVETSPVTETIPGTEWWTSYQPVSFKLDSKLGSEAEFTNMIATCKKAGVGIITDVVLNQTTGTDSAVKGERKGVAGTKFNADTASYPGFTGDKNQYPEGATRSDFHECTARITDYTNQDEVQNCRLNSMWDWNTGSAKVQDIDSDFLARLLKLGVAGFRVDAAKHINPADLKAIKQQTAQKAGKSADDIYWVQETIGNASEAVGIQPSNYFGNGDVTEFGFASELNQKFKGSISELKDLSSRLMPSEKANVFITNWDTARQEGYLTYKDGARYQLANAFMLGYGYGTPRLISDYKFGNDIADHDTGAPGATETSVPDVDMDKVCSSNTSDWNCQERWTSTRGMIAFHNYVGDAKLTGWQSQDKNNIAFSRSGKGFLAINNATEPVKVNYTTDLADGTYCNVYAAQDCSEQVEVKDGTVSTTIPARSAVALYAGATKDHHPAASQAKDPSDPTIGKEDQAILPTDQTLTVYYKADPSWKAVKMGYFANGQWSASQEPMNGPDAQGYYTKELTTGGKEAKVYFTDGNDNWDSNNSANYTIPAGIVQASIENSQVKFGNPEALEGSTRLVIHYKPAANDLGRGVYVWGTDNSGKDLAGEHHQFTGEDAWGKVYEAYVPGSFDKFNFIVTTSNWDKFGNDRSVVVAKNGTAEAWVDGSAADGADTTLTSAPKDYTVSGNLTLTVHYYRADGKYFDAANTSIENPQWNLWTWTSASGGKSASFTKHDAWGEIATITYPGYQLVTSGDNTDIGMLRRLGEWSQKDPGDGNFFVPANALVANKADGSVHGEIWLVAGDATVYTAQPTLSTTVKSASISDFTQLAVKMSKPVSEADVKGKVEVTDASGKAVKLSSVKVNGSTLEITTADELEPNAKYTVKVADYGQVAATAGAIVRTKKFDEKYAYDGNDLGATYSQKETTFKLWAPTASSVVLRTYQSDQSADAPLAHTYPMTRQDKGVWVVTVPGDMKDTAYDYAVSFADGTTNESEDPYATAATVNGDRSVVLSDEEKAIADFKRMPRFEGGDSSAIVAETHIRDFTKSPTSGVDEAKRGTYLGFVQTGTKNAAGQSTGIDYLKQLGITHVQLQPFFDYASVDETKALDDTNYNWGYDPKNYNVPEGSYSSNAADPATRIKEAKEMVKGIHDAGLRVVMDVVYNHVFDASQHAFGKVVPGYYFRYTADGKMSSDTGVGNDTASERAMVRNYIVNSVTYWAKNYKVDGFRFDLMGIHDLETMKQVRAALDKIDPSILVIGEGWDMNTMLPKSQNAIQPNAYELDNTGNNGTKTGSTVGFFNDSLRDGLRGSVFSLDGTGFAANKGDQEQLVMHNILACPLSDGSSEATKCWNGNAEDHFASPGQVVQYAEIHDNQTLFDRLLKSVPQQPGESAEDYQSRLTKMDKLATGTILLSEGQSELQVGQEFLRSKGGNENSFNAGDSVNQLNWNDLDPAQNANAASTAEFVKGLIALRKSVPGLRLNSYEEIANKVKPLTAAKGVIAYQISDETGTYVVVLNANDSQTAVTEVPAGKYQPLVLGSQVVKANTTDVKARLALRFLRAAAAEGVDNTLTVDEKGFSAAPISVSVLKVAKQEEEQPTQPGDGDNPSHPGDGTDPTQPGKDDNNPSQPGDEDKPSEPGKDDNQPTVPGKDDNKPSQPGKNENNAGKNAGKASTKAGKAHQAGSATVLASTGASVVMIAALALMALLAGASLLGLARRRNEK